MEQPSSVEGGIGGCSINGMVDEVGVSKTVIGDETIVTDGQIHMGLNDEVSRLNSEMVKNHKHVEGNIIRDDKFLDRFSEETKETVIGDETVVYDGGVNLGLNDEVIRLNSEMGENYKHVEANFSRDDKLLVKVSAEIKETVIGNETVVNVSGVNSSLNEVSGLHSEGGENYPHVEDSISRDDKCIVRVSEEIKETVIGDETVVNNGGINSGLNDEVSRLPSEGVENYQHVDDNISRDDKCMVRVSEEIKETLIGDEAVVNDGGINSGLNDEVSRLHSEGGENYQHLEDNISRNDKCMVRGSEEIKETVIGNETDGGVNLGLNDVSRLHSEGGENDQHVEDNISRDDKCMVRVSEEIKETVIGNETVVNDGGVKLGLNDVSRLHSDGGENYQHVEDNISRDDKCMVRVSEEIKETVIRAGTIVNDGEINLGSNNKVSVLDSEIDENYMHVESNFSREDKNAVSLEELNSINLVVDLSPHPVANGNEESEIKNFVTNELSKEKWFRSDLEPECYKRDEKTDEFYATDLVWGKVRSHPWWPGQIFGSSDASEKAMKHLQSDGFLIAYFGDQSFAWNDAAHIKPFRLHFSHMEKQSSTDSFDHAVNCALEEVSRRVEFGLACACVKNEVYEKIKSQVVVNAGIREESSRREGGDRFSSAHSFVPGKFVRYLKELAEDPLSETVRLEFLIARAQLLAFNRWKGYYQLPSLQVGGLLENDTTDLDEVIKDEEVSSEEEKPTIRDNSSRKRKGGVGNGFRRRKKEKRVSDLMSDSSSSLPNGENKPPVGSSLSSKKRKAVDFIPNDSGVKTRKNRSSKTPSSPPKKLSGVEERLVKHRDKTSQKTAGKNVGKSTKASEKSRKVNFNPSANELLSEICLAARDPKKGYNFLDSLLSFFSGFRRSVFEKNPNSHRGKKKKSNGKMFDKPKDKNSSDLESTENVSDKPKDMNSSKSETTEKVSDKPKDEDRNLSSLETTETFVFEGMEDSYWTDRIIQGNTEEQVLFEPELIIEPELDGNLEREPEKVVGQFEYSPTALILKFTDLDSVPSETNLNEIFNRYGPLNESETEVLKRSSRAKVVFKRRGDAETAFSSAGKFSIFGPSLVSYRLNYTPTPRKASTPGKRCRKGNSASGKAIQFED